MLTDLRAATGAAHARLDASFGALALDRRGGLARFLAAHAIGLARVFPAYRHYLGSSLGLTVPPYPALVHADLRDLGIEPDSLPVCDVTPQEADLLADPEAAPGLAYVLGGSRLGTATLARQPNWAMAQGLPARYLNDRQGLIAWKALVSDLGSRAPRSAGTPGVARRDRAIAGAILAFDLFARAFAAAPEFASPPQKAAHG